MVVNFDTASPNFESAIRITPNTTSHATHRLFLSRFSSRNFTLIHKRAASKGLTRIRRENPAFNYGFFRPNPLAFEREAGKNAGHGSDFTGPGNPEQAEIARSGSGRDSAQTF
jgi:hypothetical protein